MWRKFDDSSTLVGLAPHTAIRRHVLSRVKDDTLNFGQYNSKLLIRLEW